MSAAARGLQAGQQIANDALLAYRTGQKIREGIDERKAEADAALARQFEAMMLDDDGVPLTEEALVADPTRRQQLGRVCQQRSFQRHPQPERLQHAGQ